MDCGLRPQPTGHIVVFAPKGHPPSVHHGTNSPRLPLTMAIHPSIPLYVHTNTRCAPLQFPPRIGTHTVTDIWRAADTGGRRRRLGPGSWPVEPGESGPFIWQHIITPLLTPGTHSIHSATSYPHQRHAIILFPLLHNHPTPLHHSLPHSVQPPSITTQERSSTPNTRLTLPFQIKALPSPSSQL